MLTVTTCLCTQESKRRDGPPKPPTDKGSVVASAHILTSQSDIRALAKLKQESNRLAVFDRYDVMQNFFGITDEQTMRAVSAAKPDQSYRKTARQGCKIHFKECG